MSEWQMILRAFIAALLCSLLGFEREVRQKAAGLRTHALVGLGASLFMSVSAGGFRGVLGEHVTLDPSRIAAQVASGIGFLGAGLIIVRRNNVHGLTTAAGIWVCAAIGLACGSGLLLTATAVTLLSLGLMLCYDKVIERFFPNNEPRGTFSPPGTGGDINKEADAEPGGSAG